MTRMRGESGSRSGTQSGTTRLPDWGSAAIGRMVIGVLRRSCERLLWLGGQLESEDGAFSQALAGGQQRAAHFAGGQRAAVQTKAVPVTARGETVREDAREI